VKIMGLILLIGFFPAITSCTGEVSPVYRTWIDFPKQGGEFSPGSPIPITFHVTENINMNEVIIRVNGEIIHKGPPLRTGDPVMAISQEWIPEQPGDYTIEVAVTDEEGNIVSRAQVDIHVLGDLEALKPDLTITDIILVGSNQIECHYANLGAAVLPEGSDFWLDIILGPAESEVPPVTRANIGTGSSFIYGTSGYLTHTLTSVPSWPHLVTCRIDVDGQINESDEDNNKMAKNLGVNLAAPPLAPTVTPTYTQPPPTTQPPPPTTQPPPPTTQPPPPTDTPIPDTTPPNISGMSAVPDRIAELPCAQNSVTISAQVSDPSGVSQVKLYYRAIKGGIVGSWQIENMTHTGGNQYQIEVGPSQISASYSPYGGLILQYYVKAWDSHDNASQTSSGNVPLDYCVQ
jgi:hypothetical protein